MTAQNTKLDKRLEQLLKVVSKQDKQERAAAKLTESSRLLKWQAVVQAYLWWRAAQQVPGYLETVYQQHNIPNNDLTNRVNFNPLVRLVWNIHGDRWQHVSNTAQAITALHDEFTENPHLYRKDAEAGLIAYIQDNRGLRGIRQKAGLDYDTDQTIIEPPKKQQGTGQIVISKELRKELLKRKAAHVAAVTGIAGTDAGDAAVNTSNGTGSDLIVLLARRDENGQFSVLGSTNDTELVQQAVVECVDFDESKLTPMLRLLSECLTPHIVPRELQRRGARGKFLTQHKIALEEGGQKQDIPESVRLIITKNNEILVSKRLSHASLVTISKPKKVTLNVPHALFLRAPDRYWIETELLQEGLIPLFSSDPTDNIKDPNKPVTATKSLTIKNDATKKDREIYFYECDKLINKVHRQPTIAKSETISYSWSLRANKTFVDMICTRHLEAWLEKVSNRIHITQNKAFCFRFADDHLEIKSHYKPDETDGFARAGDLLSEAYGQDATFEQSGAENEVIVSPLDVLQLFRTIRSRKLVGPVTIKGNANLLSLFYETETATHAAHIPACNYAGKRKADHFTKFDHNA